MPSSLNAADIGSRGVFPCDIDCANIWFCGPPFLIEPEEKWPKQPALYGDGPEDDEELKKVKISTNCVTTVLAGALHEFLHYYSSFTSLQRSGAWLRRFISYRKWKKNPNALVLQQITGSLTLSELDDATFCILRLVHQEAFGDCLELLPNRADCNEIEPISEQKLKANPCLKRMQNLDPCQVNGVIRVGGRLQNSHLSESSRHPILLPDNHHVTNLLILQCYIYEGHFGCSHVLNAMRKKYWILKGRSTVKKALKACMNCRFWRATYGRQQMAPLPEHRVVPSSPFTYCGTDLMGPLYVKIGRSSHKRYVCIFNCLSTRAVHLEIVQSLETDAFIQAFRRFCNRRVSKPKVLYSDNAGNFVMANKEIK